MVETLSEYIVEVVAIIVAGIAAWKSNKTERNTRLNSSKELLSTTLDRIEGKVDTTNIRIDGVIHWQADHLDHHARDERDDS